MSETVLMMLNAFVWLLFLHDPEIQKKKKIVECIGSKPMLKCGLQYFTCFSLSNFSRESSGKPAPIGDMHFSPSLLPDVFSPLKS